MGDVQAEPPVNGNRRAPFPVSNVSARRKMKISKHLFRSVLVLACVGMGGPQANASPLVAYKHALVEYYGAVHYHPLLQPEEYSIGDVIDIRSQIVVWRQERCFPNLQSGPRSGNVPLSSFTVLQDDEASFWLWLKYALVGETGVGGRRQVLLHLEDMSTQAVSIGELRDALDDQCIDLLPILEENRMPKILGRTVNIIAGILRARQNTVLSYSGGLYAEARAELLAGLRAAATGRLEALPQELEAGFGLSGRRNVRVVSEGVKAVAYRPATIFRPHLGGTGSSEILVEPFDPENEFHVRRLEALSRAWADQEKIME